MNQYLNRKRKLSNSNNINENNIQNEDTSYELIHSYEDYDDYYEDFMNNSMINNRTFNNLNFCRPERFSFKNKKKKYSIKSEQGFTIAKTIKPKEIYKNINFSFESSIKKDNNKLELFSNAKNDVKEKDKEIGFFENDNNINNNTTNKSNVPLFANINMSNNNNSNDKILFSSNIPYKNNEKNEIEKETLNIDNINKDKDNNNDKKEQGSLFGNIDRLNNLNNSENKQPSLFGNPSQPINEKEKEIEKKLETPKKEEKKENEEKKEEEPKKEVIGKGLFDVTPTPTPEPEEKPEEKKETINNNEDNKKESQENKTLFDTKETKEEIILPILKEKEVVKEEKEDITQSKESNENTRPLFGTLKWNNNNNEDKDKDKENKNPLFSGNNSLFGNKSDNNSISLFGKKEDNNNNEMKEEKKETISFGFNQTKNDNNNNPLPLFGNNGNNDNKDNKVSSNINEAPQSNISLNTGSLVTKNNPFLNSNPSSNVPNVFSLNAINNNNKNNPPSNEPLFKVGSNANTNTFNLFNNNDNNNSIFGNNQQQKPVSIFGNPGMNDGNMNVSPNLGARSIFNNNNNPNNPSLFGSTNNTNNFNVFGAPQSSGSLFNNNNNNSLFPTNSGIGFGPGLFSGGSNGGFTFSMGKK